MSDEVVEVPKDDLVRALGGLLSRIHPHAAYDAFMTGFELLIEIDSEAVLDTLGWLYGFEDGDAVVGDLCVRYGINPELVPDHGGCAGGCGGNVFRLDESAYMTTTSVWVAAGNPSGLWCIGCLEEALGRKLVRDDFDWSTHMTASDDYFRSKRLRQRMGRL